MALSSNAFRIKAIQLSVFAVFLQFCISVVDFTKLQYIITMRVTLTVTDRGTITLPAKLRKKMGIEADSLLIAETTEDGILIRPAVALPVEVYSEDRLREFAAAEQDLSE